MTESAGNILIVDDDPGIRQSLRTTLEGFGFSIGDARNGEDAIALVKANKGETKFNAVLLDVNMAGMGGMFACRELRRLAPALPILMLTVRDSEDDIVKALEAGADDYISKPFHMRELIARLKAAVRRTRASQGTAKLFTVGDVELDPARRLVRKRGETVHLTPKEFDLLHYLMANMGMPIAHARLLQVVWGPEYGNELEYLRTFVRQLRIKIEDEPSRPTYLLTDPYVGYRFCEPATETSRQGELQK